MPVLVKICGITNLRDAELAIEAGADALGFIFYRKSPRFMQVQDVAAISPRIPSSILKVGVFVDEEAAVIEEISREGLLDRIQLHGMEPAEFCSGLPLPVIKAFRVKDQASLIPLHNYRVTAFLLDSYVSGQLGGTGEKFNWDLAVQAREFGVPIILAGGLTSENVADAVAKVSPYAVDVSSGVEASPGKKDPAKVREFIRRAKGS